MRQRNKIVTSRRLEGPYTTIIRVYGIRLRNTTKYAKFIADVRFDFNYDSFCVYVINISVIGRIAVIIIIFV